MLTGKVPSAGMTARGTFLMGRPWKEKYNGEIYHVILENGRVKSGAFVIYIKIM